MKNKESQPLRGRAAIIEAASSLFSETGYSGTTMRDIAKRVGTLPGSLYSHISSKEELLVEIVSGGIERFLHIEAELQKMSGTAEDKLRYAITAHLKVVAEDPERMLVVFHQWRFLTEPNLSEAVKLRRRYAQTYANLLKQGIKSGEFTRDLDPKVEVFSILGALNWVPEWYSVDGAYSPEEIGNKMTDTLLFGLQRR